MRAEAIQAVLFEVPLLGALTAGALRRLSVALAAVAATVTAEAWRRSRARRRAC